MKRKSGIGHIKTIILIIIITVFVASGVYYVRMQYNRAKVKTIKTNMSMIELKAKENLDKQKAEGKEISYIGTKLSEFTDQELISKLTDNGIISSDELEKYYVLSDDNIQELKCNKVSNEDNSYYLINYETNEVIITKGCVFNDKKILYKYSDIKAEDENNE